MTRFLDKTLQAASRIGQQSLFAEAYARKGGFLQHFDVRVKIIAFSFMLVVISFLHTPQALWILYGLSMLIALWSRVPAWFFIKRVWLFVPLFSAAIVLPAILNIITPGEPLWVIAHTGGPYSWGPYHVPADIAITREGLRGGIVLVSRVAASVSFAVLFTLTSQWSDLFAGLRSLAVPRAFVMTLSMTYRYLFVFLRILQDMYLGRKSRTIGAAAAAEGRSWIATRIGISFKKSVQMSELLYRAMVSRGFQGEFPRIERFHAGPMDYLFLVTAVFFGSIIIVLERSMVS